MGNVLQDGILWLSNQMDEHVSIDIVYQRNADLIPLKATKGRSLFEQVDANNMVIGVESRDFLVSSSNLMLHSQRIEPIEGDQIIESVGSETWLYEVTAFINDQCFRYCDPFRLRMRIHTKFIGEVAA